MGRKKAQGRPRIAVIGSKGLPSRTSGLEVYVEELCTALAEDYDITVFCRRRYCDEVVREHRGVRIAHVPSINTKHLDAITYSIFATVTALGGGYDLFWYHALGPAVTAWLPRLAGKRILSTVHGLDWKRAKFGRLASGMLKLGERAIAKCANEIIVLNEGDRRHFRERWGRDAHLVPNGVCVPKRSSLGAWAERLGISEGGYVLYASRIVPEKNLHVLVEAFRSTETDRRLVVAGGGVHTDGYVEEVRRLAEGDDRIAFVGHVGASDLEALYGGACCYVLPSSVEGQSIGLLEAMGRGLPCLVSDIPENREVGRDGVLYFRCGDAADLAGRLSELLVDPDMARRLGERSRAIVEEGHSFADTVAATRDVIELCIKRATRYGMRPGSA